MLDRSCHDVDALLSSLVGGGVCMTSMAASVVPFRHSYIVGAVAMAVPLTRCVPVQRKSLVMLNLALPNLHCQIADVFLFDTRLM
jgi:hypothetical protein